MERPGRQPVCCPVLGPTGQSWGSWGGGEPPAGIPQPQSHLPPGESLSRKPLFPWGEHGDMASRFWPRVAGFPYSSLLRGRQPVSLLS